MVRELRDFSGKKVTAMGLGRFGGQASAIRFLAEAGADVLVSDRADPETLKASISELSDLTNVEYRWGEHQLEDFLCADFILVSPAVKPNHPCLVSSSEKGIPVITEMELFLENCPAQILAVSGTVGKSTTATMLAYLLKQAGQDVFVGGNLGGSLLPRLEQIHSQTLVVLELSSYQLHWLGRSCPRFRAAILTNFYPHHLEWHGNQDEYQRCKQVLFQGMDETSLAVLPESMKADVKWIPPVAVTYFQGSSFRGSSEGADGDWPETWPEHWQENGNAVLKVAEFLGIDSGRGRKLLADYGGLPHRFEKLGDFSGRMVINDSKATSPWAVVSALKALEQPTWLLLGGAESTDDPQALFSELAQNSRIKGICWIGPGGKCWFDMWNSLQIAACSLHKNLNSTQVDYHRVDSTRVERLSDAFEWAWKNSQSGETILLSPGRPSFDEFLHYEQRGELLRKLAEAKRV